MVELLVRFFEKWYITMPFIFIVFSLGIYFIMKVILRIMRAIVLGITKAVGSVSAEARGSDYCLVVISGAMYYRLFGYCQKLIDECINVKAGTITAIIMTGTIVITAFIQSAAYLLFGYGYIRLSRQVRMLPQILHIIICIEWMVLVVIWDIYG